MQLHLGLVDEVHSGVSWKGEVKKGGEEAECNLTEFGSF